MAGKFLNNDTLFQFLKLCTLFPISVFPDYATQLFLRELYRQVDEHRVRKTLEEHYQKNLIEIFRVGLGLKGPGGSLPIPGPGTV